MLSQLSKSELQELCHKTNVFTKNLSKQQIVEKINNKMCHNLPNIAFCFLVYSSVQHEKIWEQFFSQDTMGTANIYSHIKNVNYNTQNWLLPGKSTTVKTEWCNENLIKAFCKMLKKALKQSENKYFCLLSGSCIPLQKYNDIYTDITKTTKSRMNYWNCKKSVKPLLAASQWVILNRECATDLLELYNSKNTKAISFLQEIKSITKENVRLNLQNHCPDELYPINWFKKLYGNKLSTKIINQETTYALWEDYNDSPSMINQKKLNEYYDEICKKEHYFARKFYKSAAKIVAMKC